MNIPPNLSKIKEAFSIEQVNQLLTEGWKLVAITPRAGAIGPAYTMGWLSGEAPDRRLSASNRARGINES
jgi:hypothetical protein